MKIGNKMSHQLCFGVIFNFENLNMISLIVEIGNFSYQFRLRLSQAVLGNGLQQEIIIVAADKKYDRIFIFSDMQGWSSGGNNAYLEGNPSKALTKYKKKFDCDPYLYSID